MKTSEAVAKVVAVAGAILLALHAAVERERERRPLLLACNAHLFFTRAPQLLELADLGSAIQSVSTTSCSSAPPLSVVVAGGATASMSRQQIAIQKEVEEALRLRRKVLDFALLLLDFEQLGASRAAPGPQ